MLVHRHALVAPNRLEHADVVITEVAVEIILVRHRDAFRREDVLIRAQVQPFAVGDHAVEVEHDRMKVLSRDHRLIRSEFGLLHFLAGANRHFEAVLLRRERAVVLGAVIAVRVIRDVEVDDVDAGRRRIELHVSSGRISFGAAGQIGKGNEQPVHVPRFEIAKRGQPQRLALHRKLQRADALEVTDLADRGRHLDGCAILRRIERRRNGVAFIDRKIAERD